MTGFCLTDLVCTFQVSAGLSLQTLNASAQDRRPQSPPGLWSGGETEAGGFPNGREGTWGRLVADQSVVWVGGVRPVGGGGLPLHMVCNCGLVCAEKGGSVMVFR